MKQQPSGWVKTLQETSDRPLVRSISLRAGWLLGARICWIVITLLSLIQFISVLPSMFVLYQRVCPVGCALTPANFQELQVWGMSPVFFAAYNLGVMSVFMGICWIVGVMFFWQTWKRGYASIDFMTIFTSLLFTTIGQVIYFNEYLFMQTPALNAWTLITICVFTMSEALLTLFTYLFPDGRFTPRWLAVPCGIFLLALLYTNLTRVGFPGLWSGIIFPVPVYLDTFLLSLTGIISVLLAIYSQVYKYRHTSSASQRRQVRWIFCAILIICLALALQQTFKWWLPRTVLVDLSGITIMISPLFFLLFVVVGTLLHYHLWEVTPLISRTLVSGVLTFLVLASYVLLVGGLGELFHLQGNSLLSLLATGLIAVLFYPVRLFMQQAINRLFYGERDDPYVVLSRLGERLEIATKAEAMLPIVVETVARALNITYAALLLKSGKTFQLVARHGISELEIIHVPLRYQGELVGELQLAPRFPGEAFTSVDQRLIMDLERQAGAILHMVILARELQRSREQLVAAREEERRRLRRDLHDGLGAVLGSQMFKLDAVRHWMHHDPARADALLLDLKQQTQQSLVEIRQLVYALRPPALDEPGLLAALRELTIHNQQPGMIVSLESSEPPVPLSAALDVAIYRIVQEALTNVARHAQACHCTVRLDWSDEILLEICDDGCGLPELHRSGVGMHAMRERAAEVGGHCRVETRVEGGTRVYVQLPWPEKET